MLSAVRRWFQRRRPLEVACLEREAQQRRDLVQQVNVQLAELIAYLDDLSGTRGNPPEVHTS